MKCRIRLLLFAIVNIEISTCNFHKILRPDLDRRFAEEFVPTLYYDVIVIGGGAVGCPLARTIAESGRKTLLLERGGMRKDHPLTQDIFGAGRVINDPDVSQLFITKQGIRTHSASVLSGGTAINLGIQINEIDEYLQLLNSFSGVHYDISLFNLAIKWVIEKLNFEMPNNDIQGKAWNEMLNKLVGRYRGHSPNLVVNTTWGGHTIFDPQNNWYRNAADILLGEPFEDMPESLDILLRHTAHRITFDDKTAKCVLFSATREGDLKEVDSRSKKIFGLRNLYDQLKKIYSDTTKYITGQNGNKNAVEKLGRACIFDGGEIIVSTGALNTPILLYRSGLGPKSEITNLDVPLVKSIEQLGRNMTDRVFIPVSTFLEGNLEPSGFEPRIVQSIGLLGDGCESGFDCIRISGFEMLSGGRLSEGIIYATRFILPPDIRNDHAADLVMRVLEDCAEARHPLGLPYLKKPVCNIARTAYNCFRKVFAGVYVLSQPLSRGSIEIDTKGKIIVDGGYLRESKDVDSAVEGLKTLIKIMRNDIFEGIFEKTGINSCPIKILNSMVAILNILGQSSRRLINEASSLKLKLNLEKWMEIINDSNKDMKNIGKCFRMNQRYSSYPIILPQVDRPDCIEDYAKTYMTSMWHWIGSAKMGEVVDENFDVIGMKNLAIIDASVLNHLTRLNPTATLLALGRYGGLLKNDIWFKKRN